MTCLLRILEPTQFQDSRGYAYTYHAATFCGANVPLGAPTTGYPSPITTDPSVCTCDRCFDAFMFHQMQQAEVLRERKRHWVERLADQAQRDAANRTLAYILPQSPEQPKP